MGIPFELISQRIFQVHPWTHAWEQRTSFCLDFPRAPRRFRRCNWIYFSYHLAPVAWQKKFDQDWKQRQYFLWWFCIFYSPILREKTVILTNIPESRLPHFVNIFVFFNFPKLTLMGHNYKLVKFLFSFFANHGLQKTFVVVIKLTGCPKWGNFLQVCSNKQLPRNLLRWIYPGFEVAWFLKINWLGRSMTRTCKSWLVIRFGTIFANRISC